MAPLHSKKAPTKTEIKESWHILNGLTSYSIDAWSVMFIAALIIIARKMEAVLMLIH